MHCCRTAETDIIQLPFLLRNRHVMNKFIYLDNAATTRVRPEVADSMRPFLENMFANPAGVYTFAGKTNVTIEEEREKIARFIGAKAKEIYFTGGGSESDNWALKGIASANKEKGRHIITSKIEHPAILRTCEFLEKKGFEITYIDVDDKGFVDLKMLEKSIRADTILISIMLANNEIGTIEPVRKIAEIAKEHGVLFHTDAVQAYGHVDINVKEMGIDLMSVSGHKINGPKGIGFLYIRSGVRIENLIHGGSQERGMRAGTVNVAGIVGMGTATELAEASLKKRFEYTYDKNGDMGSINAPAVQREPGRVYSSNVAGEFLNNLVAEVEENDLARFKEYLDTTRDMDGLISGVGYKYETVPVIYNDDRGQ